MEMMSVADKTGRDDNDIGTPEKDDGKGSPDATCERQGGTAREIWATSGRSGLSILRGRQRHLNAAVGSDRRVGGSRVCWTSPLCALWPPSQNAIHPPIHQSTNPSLHLSSPPAASHPHLRRLTSTRHCGGLGPTINKLQPVLPKYSRCISQ